MPREGARTRSCSSSDAKKRLARAREFLDIAELVVDEKASKDDSYVYSSAAASLAVLSGIAASDAACCKALGKRSRGDNHNEAMALLEQITPGGKAAGKNLQTLLGTKDRAQYPELIGMWEQVRSALADLTWKPLELIKAPDDRILSSLRQTFRGRESGVPIEVHFFALWTIRDGKVHKAEFFRHRAEALEAAGLWE
jgi:hypothetical protein